MALTIDNLQIEIESNAKQATGGIDSLAKSLGKLKSAVGDTSGLANNLKGIAGAIKSFNGVGKLKLASQINQLSKLKDLVPILGSSNATQLANNLREIAGGIREFSTIPKLNVNVGSIAKAVRDLNTVTASFDASRLAEFSVQMQGIASGLSHLSGVGRTNIGSIAKALKEIPSITASLDTTTISAFSDRIRTLTEVMTPLGVQMDSIARGFNALPSAIKRALNATTRQTSANGKLSKSYNTLGTRIYRSIRYFWTMYYTVQRVANVFADWFNESNEYIEALNLFEVTMGDASDAAMEYAEKVGDAMGIDVAEWITNQGVFQRMATGFGIVADQAEVMSQNLTQLAYDMSSFFNTDVETAMQKLQSGMSGQIKGLKAWGYNLSVAALQETALSLGIEQKVRTMTEAQKAQLRYITLIQKSNGIMGDMAKTILTPSNAMRILSAQITRMKREFGNLISIVATRFIPYVMAAVELLAELAESLAKSLGFEIESLPTNNLDMAADVIEGIGDETDDTADSLKDLKKQLMGFDELNILKKSDDTDESIKEQSYDLGIELPKYDFMSGLSTEYRAQIDYIKEQFKELIEKGKNFVTVIEAIGIALAAVFAVSMFNKAATALTKFFTTTDAGIYIAITAMEAFDAFRNTLSLTKNPLKALGSSLKTVGRNFKDIMSNLSPMTKALVSIVALFVEFKVVKSNIKAVTDGSKSWGQALLAIVPVCGAVGAAMYAMLGPWGLVAAGAVALIGGIAGTTEALDELETRIAHNALYDGFGTSISSLADDFSNLMSASVDTYKVITDKQGSILSAKENITKTKTEIEQLVFEVETGATSIEDAIPRIEEAFKSLYDNSKTALMGTASLLYAALTGTTIEGIEAYMQTISQVTNTTIEEMDKSAQRLEEAKKQLEAGTITQDQYLNTYLEETLKTSQWTTAKSEFQKEVDSIQSGLSYLLDQTGDINWESSNLESTLQSFEDSANDAKTKIKTAYQGIYDAIADLKHQAELQGNTGAIGVLDDLLNEYLGFEETDLSKVDSQLDSIEYALQENLIKRAQTVFNDAYKEWDNLSWGSKVYNYANNVQDFAAASLAKFRDEALEIETLFENVFGEGSSFIGVALENLGNAMYGGEFSDSNYKDFHLDIPAQLVPSAIKEAIKTAGADTAKGLVEGLSSEQQAVYDESIAMGETVIDAYKAALDIRSPSHVMYEQGVYTIKGLINGLIAGQSALSDVMDIIVDEFDILSPIQSLWRKVTDWWRNISLPQVNLFSNLGASIAGAFNINGYATGGLPSMGEMFIARERGPELVGRIGNKSAVANNDQIISGIASGVYNAMMAAKEDNGSGGGTARIYVQIDGRTVGEASVDYINGQIVQTGESPIYA